MRSLKEITKKFSMKFVEFWKFVSNTASGKCTKIHRFFHRAKSLFWVIVPFSIKSFKFIIYHTLIVFDIMPYNEISTIEISQKSVHTFCNSWLINNICIIDSMYLTRSKRYRNWGLDVFIDSINLRKNLIVSQF